MKNKKLFAVILAVAVLLTFAFVLSACGDDNNEEKPIDTTAPSGNNETDPVETVPVDPNPPVEEAELNVSFDENASYSMDEEEIFNALVVEIFENGVPRRVEYTITSSEVTEDRQYIKVVVAAEGLEKEILLPYEAEPEVNIREELKPLYNLFTNDGEKSFAIDLTLSTTSANGDTPKDLSLKVMINKTAEGIEFAVVNASAAEDAENILVLYKNGILSVFGYNVDALSEITGEALDGEGIVIDEDSINSFFESLSGILDTCDSVVETPGVSMMIGFSKTNGTYHISTDTKKLVTIAQIFLSGNENIGFDVDEVINLIDTLLDGAVQSGDIKITLSLSVQAEGITLGTELQNSRTGGSLSLAAALTVADEAFELPEVSTAGIQDIAIEIPLSTPNGKLDIVGKVVIHSSDIITKSGNDYITGSFTIKGIEDAAKFVVNDKYVFLDFSGFADGQPAFLYKAFEIDGQPVSIFEYIKSMNTQTDYDEDLTEVGYEDYDYENYDYEDYDYEEDDDDDYYYGGYSCGSNHEDGLFILNIGATEEDLRAQINFIVNDEPVTDYQIYGFDSSESAELYVDIMYGDIETSISVVIRDAEHEEFLGFDFGSVYITLGSDVATVELEELYADIIMTDGQVQWILYKNGFTIDKVNGEAVTEGYTFNTKGDVTLSLTYAANGEPAEISAYVYDPENLEIVEFDIYPDDLYLFEYLTEEELRDRIYFSILYDNGSWNYSDDFEIIGYEPGATEFEVKFGEYVKQITIEYDDYIWEDQPTEEPGEFNILDLLNYLRVTDIFASDDPTAALVELLKQNKDTFASVFSVDIENNTLRVVLNSSNGGDLVDVINIFFGIPGDEGFTDIDETYLIDYINEAGGLYDIGTLLNTLFGVDFTDILTDLYFEAGVSFEDGIALNLELNNGGELKYFVTGIEAKFVEASTSNFEVTEADIAVAQSFDLLPTFLFAILLQTIFL